MKLAIFSGPPKSLRLFLIRRVSGVSMLPTLREGQIIIARSAGSYRVGDIVVITHNGLEKIKRIQKIRGQGLQREIYVVGDNLARSTDSRTFGWLPVDSIQAKVICPRSK